MDKAALLPKLADTLGTSADDLTEDFALTSENWDSMAHLGAIAVIDEVYGVSVPAKELSQCMSVGEVLKLVEQQLNQHE